MEKQTLKKTVGIVFIVLAIILIGAISYRFYLNYDGNLDKTKELARQDIINLLKKGANYSNLSISGTTYYEEKGEKKQTKTEMYRYENKMKTNINGELSSIINYQNKEKYTFLNLEEKETVYLSVIEEELPMSQFEFDYSDIANQNYTYQYLGEKKVENRSVIFIKIKKSNSSYIKYSIDKDTGVLIDRIDYWNYGFQKTKPSRTVKFDVVTEKDVAIPDLTKYEKIES